MCSTVRTAMELRGEILGVWKRRRVAEADVSECRPSSRQENDNDSAARTLRESGMLPSDVHDSKRQCVEDIDYRRVESVGEARDLAEVLPEPVALMIFAKLPPRQVASSCSVISRTWAQLTRHAGLWKDFCSPWGLEESDTKSVLGGWRGLYSMAFGANLVQSACFQPLFTPETFSEEDQTRPFEATAKVLVERFVTADEAEPGYRSKSHWSDDFEIPSAVGGCNGAFRTQVDKAHQSCRREDKDGGITGNSEACEDVSHLTDLPPGLEGGLYAIRTKGDSWGALRQSISLAAFPERFLNSCPPLRLSSWCLSNGTADDVGGEFRLQVQMFGEHGQVLHHWDSGARAWTTGGWKNLSAVITGYPKGVQCMVVRVAGRGVDFTKVQAMFDISSDV